MRWRTWRGCLLGQRGARSTPRRWPRLIRTDTASGRRLRLWRLVVSAFESRAARPLRASPREGSADRPRSTRALVDLAWLSSRPTRGALYSTPLAEALLNRHRARLTAGASNACGHSVRIPCRTAHVHFVPWRTVRTPAEHSALADLAWFSSLPTRDALHPTPLAEALLHRHRARPAAVASNCRAHSFQLPCRADPTRSAPWRIGRPPTEHTQRSADFAWLCCGPTRSALSSTPSPGAQPHQHRDRSAARRSGGANHRI